MVLFPNCKINLGLYILRKREDGFHELETGFYPIPLRDALEVIQHPSPQAALEYSGSGLAVDGNLADNICVKAYYLLKNDFPHLPAVKMHLHKTIPMGAGLGGGSANGAFTLILLNKKFNLGIPEEQLLKYSLRLGSDCPFFIKNAPCFARGRGEILEPLDIDLSAWKFVLVNPRIHVNTGWAFSQIKPSAVRSSLIDVLRLPVTEWKESLINDFEEPVFRQYPEIGGIKEAFYQQGAVYAAMTGTGSTVFGIFPKEAKPSFSFPPTYFQKEV